MTLGNIKKIKKDSGFTIVELLIVIVIIGILAALVIVAYNGIQNRARTTANESAANTVAKKIEAYNSLSSTGYPTTSANLATYTESSLTGTGITFDGTQFASNNTPANDKEVNIFRCGHSGTTTAPANLAGITTVTGFRVGYWNYTSGAIGYEDIGQVSGSVGTYPTACFITT